MKRQIKFRAKAVYNNEWVYGNFIHSKRFAGCGNEFRIHDADTGLESDIHAETLGQFTENFDRNKSEIYEGDLIKYFGKILRVHIDVYSGIYLTPVNKPFVDSFPFDAQSIIKLRDEIEVIGNFQEYDQ